MTSGLGAMIILVAGTSWYVAQSLISEAKYQLRRAASTRQGRVYRTGLKAEALK